MSKVLLAGATGYLGVTIAEQLAEAQVDTTALVRNLSDTSTDPERKTRLDRLQAAGLKLTESKLNDVHATAAMLRSFDTIVSVISGPERGSSELALVEAAKQAGTIKFFIPSQYGGDYPTAQSPHAHLNLPGIKDIIGGKEAVLSALREAQIPFVKIVCFSLYGFILPAFGSFTPANAPSPSDATIYGDGTKRGAGTAEADVGRVIVKVLTDPRILNKKLVIKAHTFTQAELIAAYKQATGNEPALKSTSGQELDAQLAAGVSGYPAFILALQTVAWIKGLYEIYESELTTEEPVYASELYPQMHFQTPLEYYKSRA